MATQSFTLGHCYEVTRADGQRIKFKVYGTEKCIVIPTGEELTIHEVLGGFISVKQIECQ